MREVGLRRSVRLLSLLRRARGPRERVPRAGMSRATFLRSSAGATGALLVGGATTASASSQHARADKAGTVLLYKGTWELKAVERSAEARVARRTFGTADWSRVARTTGDGSEPETLLVELGDTRDTVLVISDPATARETALVVRWTGTDSAAAMRWYRPDGELLADMAFEGTDVTTKTPDGTQFRNGRLASEEVVTPTGIDDFAFCFAACLGTTAMGCVDDCLVCGLTRSFFACARCIACAGPKAVTCARRCV